MLKICLQCFTYKCFSLNSLPDISKWNINKDVYKNSMFEGCKQLKLSKKIKNKYK